MKYLLWIAVWAGSALAEDIDHDRFDAPAAGTLVVIGTGLVGIAALRRRRQD